MPAQYQPNPRLVFVGIGQTPPTYTYDQHFLTPDPLKPWDFFPGGSIVIRQAPILRSDAHSYIVPDFRGFRQPGMLPNGTYPKFPLVGDVGKPFPPPPPDPSRYQILVPLQARGGSLGARIITPLTAVFTGPKFPWFPNGRLLIGGLDFGTTGALSEYSFWSTGADPADTLVEFSTVDTSGTVGNDWTRHWAVISPPAKARYMAVGGYFTAQPNNNVQSIYAVQSEVLPVGTTTPTAYSDPREIRVILRPDRLNWSPNPSFINGVTNWTNLTRTANTNAPSGFSGNATITNGSTLTVEHTVPELRSDLPYLIKMRVEWDAPRTANDLVPMVGGAFSSDRSTVQMEPKPLGVVEITMTTVGASDGSGIVQLVVHNTSGATGHLKVQSVLVEQTDDASRTYFDGNTPGDYFWETGGTDGSSRSYFYRNFLARFKTVKGILADDAPMGVGVADPQYAVSPSVSYAIRPDQFVVTTPHGGHNG